MMSMSEMEWAEEAYYARQERNAQRCKCGGDMPGTCPGPAFCPMEQDEDEDE